jgi:crotonobetainyl-CoA:carnitine CoA-transferase CaiB-like acyl-CoA transferase
MPAMGGPLQGIKVVELGTLDRWPYCARLLAAFAPTW